MICLSSALISSIGVNLISSQWAWFTVYFALIAGGKDPESNDQSHQEHLSALITTLEYNEVPAEQVTIFWADGESPEVDRRLPSPKRESLAWVVEDTPWAGWFERDTLLANTRWESHTVYPAKRKALRAWFTSLRPKIKPHDSIVLAVTDHGRPDPQGGWKSSIELWGEQLSVEELYQDLQLLPEEVTIQLWMSQCFSGGFARLATMDSRVCGAFSSTAQRPAFGCFSLPNKEGVQGHFMHFNQGLKQSGRLNIAARWTVEHDQTPDTPHLSSDAFVRRVVDEKAEALGIPPGHIIDSALPPLDKLSDEQLLVVKSITHSSLRYNLGLSHSFTRVSELIKEVTQLQYTLDAWRTQWASLIHEARLRLLKQAPVDGFTQVRKRSKLRQKRERLKRWVTKALRRGKEGRRGLLRELYQRLSRSEKLLDQLKTIEAVLWRISTLYAGLSAGAVLTPHDLKLWEGMRRCESKPIFAPRYASKTQKKRKRDNARISSAFQTISEYQSEVESLRPGYLAFQYRERSRATKLEVRDIDYGSPLWAVDLQVGDYIESLEGERLRYPGQVREMVALHPIGEWMSLKRRRNRRARALHIPVVGAPLSPPPPKRGEPIPPLLLDPIIEGERLNYLMTGGQPTLLYFWASWCPECLRVAPQLKRWAKRHDIQVLAITSEDPHLVRAVNDSSPLPFVMLHDRGREASRLFNVDLQAKRAPVFVYLDVERRFIERGVGMGDRGPQQIELLFEEN